MSLVAQLGDNCFVLATESLHQLSAAFEEEVGRKPLLSELCEILTAGARSASEDLVGDGTNRAITMSGTLAKEKARRPSKAGELFWVPYGEGRRALIIALGKFGRFGSAFGIFKGDLPRGDVPDGWTPAAVFEHPLFVDEEAVRSSRWPAAGLRPDLIKAFRTPELYYHPRHDPGNGSYGPHGIAEGPTGEIRKLDESEASRIFDRDLYRHAFLVKDFEAYLSKVLA